MRKEGEERVDLVEDAGMHLVEIQSVEMRGIDQTMTEVGTQWVEDTTEELGTVDAAVAAAATGDS